MSDIPDADLIDTYLDAIDIPPWWSRESMRWHLQHPDAVRIPTRRGVPRWIDPTCDHCTTQATDHDRPTQETNQ